MDNPLVSVNPDDRRVVRGALFASPPSPPSPSFKDSRGDYLHLYDQAKALRMRVRPAYGGPVLPEEQTGRWRPALATGMPTRALDAGVPARWVTGDEVSGGPPSSAGELEARGVGDGLAVACDIRSPAANPPRRWPLAFPPPPGGLAAWQRVCAGRGANGHRTTKP
jgi:hypothetical protein